MSDSSSSSPSPSAKPEHNIYVEANDLLTEVRRLTNENKLVEALAVSEQAINLLPDIPGIRYTKGIVLYEMGRIDQAIATFQGILDVKPDEDFVRLILAYAQLKTGDFKNGWRNYEVRWLSNMKTEVETYLAPWKDHMPLWLGEAGEHQASPQQGLIVLAEQGMGDNLQFSRLLPEAAKHFGEVGFLCPPPILRLLEQNLADYPNIYIFSEKTRYTEDWDCYCPVMSLPLALNLQLDNLSDLPYTNKYLQANQSNKLFWQSRLQNACSASKPRQLCVGICWKGSANNLMDRRRSLKFSQLTELLQKFGQQITWVSLQKSTADRQKEHIPIDALKDTLWLDWTEEFYDLADTAALIANLDLVISVDSVVAHLAAAMNVPTFMIDRFDSEWRWLHQRQDSPWYPALRIFRQSEFGNWDSVFPPLERALTELLASVD